MKSDKRFGHFNEWKINGTESKHRNGNGEIHSTNTVEPHLKLTVIQLRVQVPKSLENVLKCLYKSQK